MLVAYIDEKIYNNIDNYMDLLNIDRRLLTGACNIISAPDPIKNFKNMHELNLKNIQKEQSLLLNRKLTRKEKKEYNALIIVNAEVYKILSDKQKKIIKNQKAKLACI